MKTEKIELRALFIIAIISIVYSGIAKVLGVQGANTLELGNSTRLELSQTSSASVLTESGNVTNINLSGRPITDHWAGFYGLVSGNLSLGDADGNIFYDWTGIGGIVGEVIASNDSTVEWATIECMNESVKNKLEANLGLTGADTDRVNNTYSTNTHADFTLASIAFNDCNSTHTYQNNVANTTLWFQMLLQDESEDPVYVTLINQTETGFNGNTYDFELLVGQSDLESTTTMYFYVEID